jgi:hypothetical protein
VPGGPRGLQNRRRRASGGVGSIPILSALVNCGLAITDCGLQNVTMTTQELKNRTFDESAYWMEVIIARKLLRRAQLKSLLAEANELLAITVASIKTARRRHRA